MARRRRGNGLVTLLVTLLVVAVVGVVAYWYVARSAVGAVLDRISDANASGAQIACSDRRIEGFPFRVTVGCGTVALATRPGMIGELAGLAVQAPLYLPGSVTTELRGPLTLNLPAAGLALTASWSQATASASAWLDGLTEVSAAFLALTLESAAGGPLPLATATAGAVEGAATPQDGDIYRFAGGAKRLSVTGTDGRTLPEMDLDLSLRALDFGSSLGTDPREKMLAWLRRGGTAEIERFRLGTGGATISADGTLTLAADGLLSGALAVRFTNLEALASLIEALRPGSSRDIEPALAAVMAMTVPVDSEDGPARQTSLVIRDGVVAVGIIPVTTLPAVHL